MKYLVSGATGFIGRHLCQRLLTQGDSLVALSRSGAALADGSPTLGLDLATTDPDPVSLAGVDVVFHLAGIAHQRADNRAYHELNYLATLRLARQAATAGVRTFVFLSSVRAMGAAADAAERSEQDCTEPVDAYGQSKRQAERALSAEFAAGPMSVVILRPALVYGKGSKGNLALLAGAVRAGLPRPPVGGRRSMVDLQDLVELMCTVGAISGGGVQTWIVTDGRAYTTRYIFDQLRAAAGRNPGVEWLPVWGWRIAAALLDRVLPQGGDSTFDKLFATELYSNSAVCAATGWRPRRTLADAIPALLSAGGVVEP